jgi:hypothetical protein
MVALSVYQSGLCPKCGRPISVCTDPVNEFKFKTGAPTRCHATTSQAIAAEQAKVARIPQALMFHTALVD